jgi:hypothetical protein
MRVTVPGAAAPPRCCRCGRRPAAYPDDGDAALCGICHVAALMVSAGTGETA